MSEFGPRQAHQAQLLLDNPLLKETAEELEKELFDLWWSSSDAEEREKLHTRAEALDTLMSAIVGRLENYLIDNPEGEDEENDS